jgi:hypothetical protein
VVAEVLGSARRWRAIFGGPPKISSNPVFVVTGERDQAVERAVQLVRVNVTHVCVSPSGKTPQAGSLCRKRIYGLACSATPSGGAL